MPQEEIPFAAPLRPSASGGDPDAHGQAALLLVESLIHGLIEGSVLTLRQAVDIVDIASEVKEEVAEHIDEPVETKRRSLGMLAAIGDSLRRELGE